MKTEFPYQKHLGEKTLKERTVSALKEYIHNKHRQHGITKISRNFQLVSNRNHNMKTKVKKEF